MDGRRGIQAAAKQSGRRRSTRAGRAPVRGPGNPSFREHGHLLRIRPRGPRCFQSCDEISTWRMAGRPRVELDHKYSVRIGLVLSAGGVVAAMTFAVLWSSSTVSDVAYIVPSEIWANQLHLVVALSTAEAAGSSPVVPAILLDGLQNPPRTIWVRLGPISGCFLRCLAFSKTCCPFS